MKKITLISILIIMAITIFGQHDDNDEIKTLFGNDRSNMGGYGAFGAGYTIIDDKDAITMNGRGVWLVNRGLGIGISGTAFINDFHYDAVLGNDINLTGGYGGLIIEPILFPRSPVHIAFPVIAGIGGIAYTRSNRARDNWDYRESWVEDTETYLVFEPAAEIELNLLKFFRLAGGISYRYTSPVELINTPSKVLEGVTTNVTFKFGKF